MTEAIPLEGVVRDIIIRLTERIDRCYDIETDAKLAALFCVFHQRYGLDDLARVYRMVGEEQSRFQLHNFREWDEKVTHYISAIQSRIPSIEDLFPDYK